MKITELLFACTALREMCFISNEKKEVIEKWIADNHYNIDEIAKHLDSYPIESRRKNMFGAIDRRTAIELLNREIVGFNYYYPEKAVGGINHKIAAFRLLAGISQAELAQKIGVSEVRILEFENKVKFSNFEKLDEIMKVLNLTISKKA